MELGIVGTGKIVQEFLPLLEELGFHNVCILSTLRSKAQAELLLQQYQLKQCFTDYQTMLKQVDVVYIAVPNHLHFTFAEQALKQGKHVICEKPMTSNTAELNYLIQLAEHNHVMLLEAMTIYHMPAFQSIKKNLHKLGDIKLVSLNYSQYSSRYDAFCHGKIQPVFDNQKSGGALMDINIYNVHTMIGLFGKPEQVKYAANIQHNIDTSGILLCTYSDFQAVCIGAKDCASQQASVMQGERATLSIGGAVNGMKKYEIQYQDGGIEQYEWNDASHQMLYEFVEFIDIIEKRDWKRYKRLMQNSLLAAEVMENARQSAGISFPCDNF